MLYMKQSLGYDADTVQKLSSMGIAGSTVGFLIYGLIQKKLGMRNLQITVHALWLAVAAGFFCCFKGMPLLLPLSGALLFLSSLAHAWFNCCFSQECLALSRPGNNAMASALASTYNSIGNAIGRTAGSILLGNGLLAVTWKWHDFVITDFQSLFLLSFGGILICGVMLLSLPSVIPNHDDYYKP